MSAIVRKLAWDTSFFGFPVARVDCDEMSALELGDIIKNCNDADIKLLYLFVNHNDDKSVLILNDAEAEIVDYKVTYVMDLVPSTLECREDCDLRVEKATETTLQLESLALQSGEFSRFRIDSKFPPFSFERLYKLWLSNSLNGLIAKDVLVVRNEGGKESGLLTLGQKNGIADIGILAVDNEVRGKGIGRQLIAAAQRIAISDKYKQMQVVTQSNNKLACGFYERCGFEVAKEERVYHLWLK